MIRPDIENLKNGRTIVRKDDWTITAPPAAPEIFDWIDHLEAENAQLKAHNRQMVGALGELMELSNAPKAQFKIKHGPHDTFYCLGDDVPKIGPQTIDSEERKAYWDAFKTAKQALQTPPAKLAQAEAEVLRAAEAWFSHNNDPDSLTILSFQERLEQAIEEMQEAKRGGY